jgi:hypothetical protein
VEDMCYERRRAEACVDESAHHVKSSKSRQAPTKTQASTTQAQRKGAKGLKVVGGPGSLCGKKNVSDRAPGSLATHTTRWSRAGPMRDRVCLLLQDLLCAGCVYFPLVPYTCIQGTGFLVRHYLPTKKFGTSAKVTAASLGSFGDIVIKVT